LDPTGRAPGRGAYLCRDTACWDAAARKRSLEHALGVSVPEELLASLARGGEVSEMPGSGDNQQNDTLEN
jgi:hypothetical protein